MKEDNNEQGNSNHVTSAEAPNLTCLLKRRRKNGLPRNYNNKRKKPKRIMTITCVPWPRLRTPENAVFETGKNISNTLMWAW